MPEELVHMHHLPIFYKMSLRCIALYLIHGSHPSQAGVPFIMALIKKTILFKLIRNLNVWNVERFLKDEP